MSDFDSSLPIRTEQAGDVIVKVADATVPSRQLKVETDGSINVNVETLNIDIRDLAFATDKVDVSGSVISLDTPIVEVLEDLATEASLIAQTAIISSINTKLEADNIKQKILKAEDRDQVLTYADFGTRNQRIIQLDYTSIIAANGITARKTITYTPVGNLYRRDSITWSLI